MTNRPSPPLDKTLAAGLIVMTACLVLVLLAWCFLAGYAVGAALLWVLA